MDANFQLRSKVRGVSSQDTTLGLGWSYFVDYLPYSDFIWNYINEEEVLLLIIILFTLLTIGGSLDTDLCGVFSTAEHANKKVKGVKGNRTCSGQLCMAPTILSTGCQRPAEGRVVSAINN